MAEPTLFRGVIEFFGKLGIYEVVLPFLFIFTIVYAILDKTRVLGTEKTAGGVEYPKRNINSVVAFAIAFFVVASTRLVAIVNEAMANIVILLLLIFSFLLLIGSFFKEGEPVFLQGTWRTLFMIIMFIGIALVFLNAVKTESGRSWLSIGWAYVVRYWSGQVVGSIVFLLVIIGVLVWITKGGGPEKPKTKEEKG